MANVSQPPSETGGGAGRVIVAVAFKCWKPLASQTSTNDGSYRRDQRIVSKKEQKWQSRYRKVRRPIRNSAVNPPSTISDQ
jgi:hypothetical protein